VSTTANTGVLVRDKQNQKNMLQQVTVSLVWRNLEAYDVLSLSKKEQMWMLINLEQVAAERSAGAPARGPAPQLFVDKYFLFDDYTDRLTKEGDNEVVLGTNNEWDFLEQQKEKSSHWWVEIAFNVYRQQIVQRMQAGKGCLSLIL
jgi:hypothetical protein